MIDIPVHNMDGQEVDTLQIDEQLLGGEVRLPLLKQAYVRLHANQRQGSAHTRSRAEVVGSTRKLYRQKGSGNARRGAIRTNVMRGGGRAFAKHPHKLRMDMPRKMRRLANRNALLAKAVDGQIKIVDQLKFDKPSTKQFVKLLANLQVDRTCLVALADSRSAPARSVANIEHVNLTNINQLNAFALLNHRYLVVEKQVLADWLGRVAPVKEDG